MEKLSRIVVIPSDTSRECIWFDEQKFFKLYPGVLYGFRGLKAGHFYLYYPFGY